MELGYTNCPMSFRSEVLRHKILYFLLGVIILIAFILRIWRVGQILAFHFDQGRDALVIWDLWHSGKLFMIGPTTGIEGIFRGPFYYYLIAPFYLLGGGNPIYPAIFLAFLSVLALMVMYFIGYKISGKTTGLIAVILGAFSFAIIYSSRWLSNPTPMLLLSMLLVLFMVLLTEAKKRTRQTDLLWVGIAFIAGLSQFHFGSSGEFFYFPALAAFAIWQRKKLPKIRNIIWPILVFISTALPLIIFDLRHGHILLKNLLDFLSGESALGSSIGGMLQRRLDLYYEVFSQKFFPEIGPLQKLLFGTLGLVTTLSLPRLMKNDKFKVVILMTAAPFIGFLFFQGNYGNVYDYYFTGYYLIFLLFVATVLGYLWNNIFGKIFVIVFLIIFLSANWATTQNYLSTNVNLNNQIMFANQKEAIEWIYADAGGKEFNVDVYVPPVIPYSYDYLFTWKPNPNLVDHQVPLLYTLFEVDPPHPERLQKWYDRQEGIGISENQKSFGGITVQRRIRI